MSNGSGEFADGDDIGDGRGSHDRIKEVSDHLQGKMLKTRDLIKQEQKARDGKAIYSLNLIHLLNLVIMLN